MLLIMRNFRFSWLLPTSTYGALIQKNIIKSVWNTHRVQPCMKSHFSSCMTQPGEELLSHGKGSLDEILSTCSAEENRARNSTNRRSLATCMRNTVISTGTCFAEMRKYFYIFLQKKRGQFQVSRCSQ